MKNLALKLPCLALLLFAAFPAAAGPETKNAGSGGAARDEIVIGCVVPLTGEAAIFGQSIQRGVQLTVDEINKAGGILGRTVRLVMADDRGDWPTGAEECRRLIEREGAVAIIGALMSKVSLAIAPICQEAGVPMLSPTSTNLAVTQVGDFIFRACFVDPYQGVMAASFASRYLGLTKAAVLYDMGNDYSTGLAREFVTTFGMLGGRIVAEQTHGPGSTDFSSQLRRIIQQRPEIIFIPDYYNDAALIMVQARELGYKGKFLGGDGWDSPELARYGGEAVEGAFFVNHWASGDGDPDTEYFTQLFRGRFGDDPDVIAVLACDSMLILYHAINRAGSTEGAALRDALAATELELFTGWMSFDGDRNPVKSAVIMVIEDGVAVYSDTVDPIP